MHAVGDVKEVSRTEKLIIVAHPAQNVGHAVGVREAVFSRKELLLTVKGLHQTARETPVRRPGHFSCGGISGLRDFRHLETLIREKRGRPGKMSTACGLGKQTF